MLFPIPLASESHILYVQMRVIGVGRRDRNKRRPYSNFIWAAGGGLKFPAARPPARIDSPPKQATTIEIGRIEIGDLEFT